MKQGYRYGRSVSRSGSHDFLFLLLVIFLRVRLRVSRIGRNEVRRRFASSGSGSGRCVSRGTVARETNSERGPLQRRRRG